MVSLGAVRKHQTVDAHAETHGTRRAQPLGGRRALDLDRLIHERTRLAIVSALAVTAELSFTELKKLLELTDGNLSVHCRKLEDAHYLDCKKGFDRRVPKTTYRLTAKGRRALERYVTHMDALIASARQSDQ